VAIDAPISGDDDDNRGRLIGIVLGVIGLLLLIALIIVIVVIYRKRRSKYNVKHSLYNLAKMCFLLDKSTKLPELNARTRSDNRYIWFLVYVSVMLCSSNNTCSALCKRNDMQLRKALYWGITLPLMEGWVTPTRKIYCLAVVSYPAKFVELIVSNVDLFICGRSAALTTYSVPEG